MTGNRKIKVLPPQLANMIAAGEVVERPASVVKELVENSIDAGAKHITVEIKNGGITYIRVTDDGKGIPPEDAKTAFMRHATSKIEKESDLEAITTMGFRGEALAALSAVSKVDMFTCAAGNDEGRHVSIEGGEITDDSETGCPVGTNIVVRDLFYNVPARAKFMKKDSTEASRVEEAVLNAAIAYPHIAFKFIKDNRDVFSSSGNGNLRDVMYEIVGKDIALNLMRVGTEISGIGISGFIAAPDINRSTRGMQGFFVNGRPVRSKVLTAAVDEAYKGRMMVGRQPIYYLMLTVHPSMVDVNIHPAKLEVKFAREREVFLSLRNAVSAVLDSIDIEKSKSLIGIEERSGARPKLFGYGRAIEVEKKDLTSKEADTSLAKVASPDLSKYNFGYRAPKQEDEYNSFKVQSINAPEPFTYSGGYLSNPACDTPKQEVISGFDAVISDPVKQENVTDEFSDLKVIGELFRTYIIAQNGNDVWLIDKHAVHEREIYNRIKSEGPEGMEQLLCIPRNVSMSRSEKQTLLDNVDTVSKLGFDISDIGTSSLLVRSAPHYIDENDIPAVLSEIAEKLSLNKTADADVFDSLLKSVACKSAVKAGMKSEIQELTKLARDVLTLENLRNCPHGRPTTVKLTRREIEKMFKRIV